MASHECKHSACRADIGGCVCGYAFISRVKVLQNVCGSLSEDISQAQANTRLLWHKADRLVTGALWLAVAGASRVHRKLLMAVP